MIPGLVERIRAGGPIPFAAFMEAALYDPVGGFYAARRSGRGPIGPVPHLARGRTALRRRAGPRPRHVVGGRRPAVALRGGRRRGGTRHAGSRRAGRPAGRGRRRRPPLRRRGAGGGAAGGPRRPGRGLRRGGARRAVRGCRGRQRAARQPALPPRGPRRRMAGGLRRRRPGGGRPVEVLVPFAEVPACLPSAAAHGRPSARAGRGGALGRATWWPASGRPGGSW